MANTGTRDQRRHPRLATREVARFSCIGVELPCEIRNYCLNGLYLSFPDQQAVDALLPKLAGATAKVEFVGDRGEGQRFQIDALVVHISVGGLGLHVEHMPDGALQALHAAALVTAAIPSALQQSVDPMQGKAMHQECSTLFRNFLDAVLQDFFSQASVKLTEASYELSSFIERSHYVQSGQLLTQRRVHIQEEFFNTIRQHIQRIGQPEDDQDSEEMDTGLSLVAEDEFQDWLNLSGAINEVEMAATTQLVEFERNYSLLIGASLQRKRNPFAPELLCRSFQDAIQFLEFSNAMRAILYRSFGHALTQHIRGLYEQMNKVLLPLQPAAPAKRKKSDTKADAPAPAAQERVDETRLDAPEIADTQNNPQNQPSPPNPQNQPEAQNNRYPQFQPEAQYSAPAPANVEYSLDRILASINQPARMMAGQAGGQVAGQPGGGQVSFLPADAYARGRAAGGWAPAAPGYRPYPIEMAGWLQQTSRQMGGGQPPQGGSVAVSESLPEANLRELLAALNALPLSQGQPRDGAEPPPALSDQVQQWLATAGGKPMRVAPTYRQTLDMASGLIGRARAEHVASSEVEQLLKRLERPLLKLAIEDEDFLVASDHPARQVVNLLDQYAIAADNKGKFFDPKLQRFLSLMVDRVCSRASEEPGTYATVRDNLAKMLAPIRQARRARVARLQESHEAREKIRQARARVGDALEARFAGRDLPELLLQLLDGGWRQYLILLEMREGVRGEDWAAGLAVLDQLASGLGEGRPSESELQRAIRPLLNLIESKLTSVNVDSAQRSALMEELTAGLQRDADTALPTARYLPPAKPAAVEGVDEVALEQLKEQLRVGEWWEFSLEGNWVPMQIIWVSQPPANCAFANRSATDKQELGLAELSRQIQGGQARPGRNLELPLLERSEFALFDDNYHGLLHQLHQDPVTGLDNRGGFLLKLGQAAAASARRGVVVHSLCILEFDQFRLINNQHGPKAGETLSRRLADELRKLIRPADILSAFREDTFALYLHNLSEIDAAKMAEGLVRQLGDYRYQFGDDSYSIGLNLGLAEYAPALVGAVEALRRADSACLTAKSLGRNRIQAFEPSNIQLQTQESIMELAGRIDALMSNGGLHLRCQMVTPIGADSALLPYYEILLGITGDDGNSVPPMLFIPAIESLKRSHEIDIWVAKKAFAWIRANRAYFSSIGGFSINLSALSLSHSEVLAFLLSELALADLPTEKIIFEITETAAIENYQIARDFMQQISSYGCKFSLDDFGSGYSSYSHLKNLRTCSLKIDGSFVKEMAQNPADYAMVKSMNDIGHSLGMKTVAEYVESAEILSMLREIGVDYAQGYVIHKPVPIDDLTSQRTL